MVLEDETPRSEGTKNMTGEEPRSSTISTVNNDAIESKPKGSSIAENYRYKRKDQSFLKNTSNWHMERKKYESRQARNSQIGNGPNQNRLSWNKRTQMDRNWSFYIR
jgi:hypothetical protein